MAAEGPVAVDHRGPPVEHRLEQPRDVLRVVLQIGVEDDHVIPGAVARRYGWRRPCRRCARGCAADPRVVERGEHIDGGVAAAVVDDHELDFTGVVHRQRLLEGIRDAGLLVVDRHEDG